MNNHDVVQIVDVYSHYYERGRQTRKTDADGEAQSLSMLVKPLGRKDRKIAIVARDDERRLVAYQRAGYETQTMNGNRPQELRQFILEMTSQIEQAPPKHMVLVSDDPEFVHLCNAVARLTSTSLAVWTTGTTPPRELTKPNYGWRPLEELLPNLKIPRIDVRIDLENVFIGLVQRGWQPNLAELIEAIRLALEDLGEVVALTGYADFSELDRHHGGAGANWQRAFTLAGGESRYVVNQHGKNTADMKVADDIRTLVEHDPSAGSAIDIIGLVTMDRDFRHIVETAQRRGKKVVVLALEGGISRELEGAASEVRFLNKFLKFPKSGTPDTQERANPGREESALMMRIAAWLQNNRWRFVYRDRLEKQFAHQANDAELLRKLIADRWLIPNTGSPTDSNGQMRSLQPNPDHTAAKAAAYLSRWIPARVDYCLNKRGMPHVDSNFLATGMARDATLAEMNVGQSRADAESWLYAAATAGLVVAHQQPHPHSPSKLITIWRLPDRVVRAQASQCVPDEPKNTASPTSSHLREVLTHKLNDGELTRLMFDYFRPVYREVEGAPKFERIQALLDYVERGGQNNDLLSAIWTINPATREEFQAQTVAV